jgi:hypothetical protein|nr:MAG TPA: baseplate wedge protein [Caudoviricetes sp.]
MSTKTNTSFTLDQFADSKSSNDISYYSMSLLEKDPSTNIEYDVFNVISDYMNELKQMSHPVTLSETEYYTYRFKPKLLAKYLYGNTELYFIILWINDMWSVKDFNLRTIKLIKNTELSEALSKINASEKSFIKAYNEAALANF